MTTGTSIGTTASRLSLLLILVATFGLLAPAAWAQSELVVEPGAGTLNDAIENDTDRPADRVYVLQRGAYYGITRELNNEGFVLRLKAADGEGNRPVIYPAPDQAGDTPGSRWLRLVGDTYFDGIYFLGVSAENSVNGIPGTINAEGQRLVVNNSVFEGGRSRWWEVNAEDTKIYIRNSQFRNQVRYDGSSNARAFDYRTVAADTLLIENTSFLNVNGYIIRYDGPVFGAFIFNHNTVFLSNHELHSYSLATQPITYHVTNNLFINPMAFGEAPPEEGDSRNGFIRVDSLDEDIQIDYTEDDRDIVIQHNNVYFTQDVMDFYQARTDAGDPLQEVVLVEESTKMMGETNPNMMVSDNINDPVNLVEPPSMAGWVDWFGAYRDGAAEPPEFSFGDEDGLFPAEQPLPEDLSYAETDVAYTAAEGGFPLGDLNWFPDRKADWEASQTAIGDESGVLPRAFALRGNYPNPFSATTSVGFALSTPAEVAIEVFDVLGRSMVSVPAKAYAAGDDHRVTVDASALPAGVYLYRVTADTGRSQFVKTGTMTLVK